MPNKNVSIPDEGELADFVRAARIWAVRSEDLSAAPFSAFAREAMRRMIEQEKLLVPRPSLRRSS